MWLVSYLARQSQTKKTEKWDAVVINNHLEANVYWNSYLLFIAIQFTNCNSLYTMSILCVSCY